MFTTREVTFIAKCSASAVRTGLTIYACLPGGIVKECRP